MAANKYLRRVDGKDDPLPDNVQSAVSKYLRANQQHRQPKPSRYLKALTTYTAGGVEIPYDPVQEQYTAYGAAFESGESFDTADEDNQQITDVIRDKQDFRRRLRAALEAEFPEIYDKSKSTHAKEQTVREMISWHYVSELSSSLPTIPLPEDIDLSELKKEYKRIFADEDVELFVLPIGAINAESRNGRTYLASAIHDLVTQVNELRPEGMWGHLRDEELSTRYDPPAIRWLAAKLVGDVAYGLLLPLTVEARDYYRLARATGANVATSITAQADINQKQEVTHLSLHTIDIADPTRVGILATVSKVH
jgi:hypothetical protein